MTINQLLNDNSASADTYFRLACLFGHKTIAEWFYNITKEYNILFFDSTINSAFRYACIGGHLEMAKWVYNLSTNINIKIDLHYKNEWIFFTTIAEGYKNIAEWLYELSKTENNIINIHANNCAAFREACLNNNYELVKWLYELSKNNESLKKLSILPIRLVTSHENHNNYETGENKNENSIAKLLYELSKSDELTEPSTIICEEFDNCLFTINYK